MDSAEQVVNSEDGDEAGEVVASSFSVRATIGYSIVVGLVAVVAQIFFIIVWAIAAPLIRGTGTFTDFAEEGNCLLGAGFFSYPIVFGITYLIIRSRGFNFSSYIGWHGWRALRGKGLFLWFGVLIGTMILNGILMHISGATSSETMIKLIESASPYLVVAMMVFGAPLIEEIFFRGFMFKGLEASRIGGVGAIIVTSLIWAIIHGGQYNWAEISYLIVLGLFFGYARLKTGAVCLPITLHVVNNLIAVVPALIWGVS